MFDLLRPGKGFAMTFENGSRVEVDFGPMSHSEKINSSQKECDHQPASHDAEVRLYRHGDTQPSLVLYNQSPSDLINVLAMPMSAS